MAFENSAVDNLRKVCEKNDVDDFKCMTIHKCLGMDIDGNIERDSIDLNGYDVIIVDELFRLDPNLLSKLYFKLKEFNGKLILIGHVSQIKNISDENYNYGKCDCIGELVNFNYFKFNDDEMNEKLERGECRYTREMYDMLVHFEKFRNLNGFKFKPIDLNLKTNLSGSNKFNDKINNRFSKKIKVGDKIILTEHYEKDGFFKGDMLIVEKI